MMKTFWVLVTVTVPVKTDHPSPYEAEKSAKLMVQERLSGTKMHVTSASYASDEREP